MQWEISPSVRLSPDAAAVLAATRGQLAAEVEPEILRSQIEIGTPVCTTVSELRTELTRQRRELAASAGEVGCRIAASGTWAAATPQVPPTPKERYEQLVDAFGPPAHPRGVRKPGTPKHYGLQPVLTRTSWATCLRCCSRHPGSFPALG